MVVARGQWVHDRVRGSCPYGIERPRPTRRRRNGDAHLLAPPARLERATVGLEVGPVSYCRVPTRPATRAFIRASVRRVCRCPPCFAELGGQNGGQLDLSPTLRSARG